MKPIETERLIIRNWSDRDRDLFFEINSDDRVIGLLPVPPRPPRAQSDAFLDRIRGEIETRGFGFTALELKQTGETIGFAGLMPTRIVPSRPRAAWRSAGALAQRFWGHGYATEAAERLLAFGFEELALPEIVSFAVWNNHPLDGRHAPHRPRCRSRGRLRHA